MLLTEVSLAPKDLMVFMHSVVLIFHTLTVPSDEALKNMFDIALLNLIGLDYLKYAFSEPIFI